jgi:ATP-dependent protease ClpP protease subunit
MNHAKRIDLIGKIENKIDSNIFSLIYNTTNTRFRTQLASDVLPCLNILLKSLPKNRKKEKMCLFLHSAGGYLDGIQSFVYMIRKNFKKFHIIIPEIAHSAATILSLGSDKIFMSYYSSLSPFDPQITIKTQAGNIAASVEDIQGYYSLIKDFFKNDMAKIQAFSLLANRFPPEVMGQLARVQQQVKMIAENMLFYQNFPKQKINVIVKKFQKEFFSHNYRIHYDEAKDIGLNVTTMDESLDKLCLTLLSLYSESFGGQADLEVEIPEGQNSIEIVINRAYLESKYTSYSYKTKYRVFTDKRVEVEELGWLKN